MSKHDSLAPQVTEAMSADEYRNQKPPKASKYRNVKVEVDGHKFDSKAEAAHYWDLKQLERAGEIRDLELQPTFPLVINGVPVAQYRADFRFKDADGAIRVQDVKGVKTPVYKLKAKMVKAIYGIDIEEVQAA